MGRIPEETIQQVLAATDIVELIGRYVTLRKRGPDFWAPCPFHSEKSPSFKVSPTHRNYHCFGCGVGGTAIRFLMEHDGMAFTDAVKKLADAANIRIEEEVWDAEAEREAKQRASLRQMMEDLAAWYHLLLMRNPMADQARDYLKNRGINSAIAKNWKIGYSPDRDMYLRRWAAEKKYSDHLLLQAGILKQADDGRSYAFFRNRIMIPIRNQNGECIGFTARTMDPNEKRKYVNSPETVLFSKSKVLFGIDKAKRAIAKAGQVIVCEGQLDTIAVHEAGVHNVVGTQGTAFTEHHAKMLKNLCGEAVLCFDSDNAGVGAAEKSYRILSPAGLVVRVARLAPGEDPDSFIRSRGVDAFKQAIEKAVDFLDFQIAHKKAQSTGDVRQQVQLIEQTAVTIAMNPSVAARDLMIRSHAAQLGITEDALRKEVNNFARRQLRNAQQKQGQPSGEPRQLTPAEEGRRLLASQHPSSQVLTRYALGDGEVLDWVRSIDLLPILDTLPGTEMLRLVWDSKFQGGEPTAQMAWFATLEPAAEAAFTQLLAQAMPKPKLDAAHGCWHSLDLARLHHLIQQTQAHMREPGLEPEQIGEMHAQVMAWQKEYLDRKGRSPDTG